MRNIDLQDFYKKLAGYNYIPPDLENTSDFTLIYDFYFLESLRGIDLSPKREDINLQSFYEEYLTKIIDKFKQVFCTTFLDYAMSRNFMNIFYKNKIILTSEDFNLNHNEFIMWISKYHPEYAQDKEQLEAEIFKLLSVLSETDPGYRENKYYEYLDIYPLFLEYLDFLETNNNNSFVDVWYNIYETVSNLKNSNNLNFSIILIDHLIDMEHHHGNIFERILDSNNIEEEKQNIIKMLNLKSNFQSLEEFLPYISSSLKPFAIKVIYNLTGRTEEMRNEK